MKVIKTSVMLIILLIILSATAFSQNRSLIIIDFEAIGIAPEEATVFTEHLQVDLFDRDEYTLLEQPEIKTESGVCSAAPCLIEAGNIAGTDLVIGGKISKIGNSYSITANLIDVRNQNTIKKLVYDHEGDIVSLLSTGVAQIVDRLLTPPVEEPSVATQTDTASVTPSTPTGKAVQNPGGIGPALASCLIGPRVGLEMNEGINEIHTSEWIALGGEVVGGSAKWPFTAIGHMIVNATRAYMAYDRGGINNSFEGALASFCLGPRVGNELHYRKIRTNEWLQLCCVGKILITLEAYEGKTMTEIEIEEGLRK